MVVNKQENESVSAGRTSVSASFDEFNSFTGSPWPLPLLVPEYIFASFPIPHSFECNSLQLFIGKERRAFW